MRWLPWIEWQGWTACREEADYEGRVLVLLWGRWTVELACGKREARG